MTSMSTVPPLTMSQTKDELLRHLNMPAETYALMAQETSRVYKWLTKDPAHLKKNCKRQPPYDWSDIQEKAKDQAMLHIVESGDECTRYYWNLAKPTPDCPNWIAKWFLYHKFRYRDGRSRSSTKVHSEDSNHHTTHRHSHQYEDSAECSYNGQYQGGAMHSDASTQSYYPQTGTSSWATCYDGTQTHNFANSQQGHGDQESKTYYDPVRDV